MRFVRSHRRYSPHRTYRTLIDFARCRLTYVIQPGARVESRWKKTVEFGNVSASFPRALFTLTFIVEITCHHNNIIVRLRRRRGRDECSGPSRASERSFDLSRSRDPLPFTRSLTYSSRASSFRVRKTMTKQLLLLFNGTINSAQKRNNIVVQCKRRLTITVYGPVFRRSPSAAA